MTHTGKLRFAVVSIFVLGFLVGSLFVAFWLVAPQQSPLRSQGNIPAAAPTPTLPAQSTFGQIEAFNQVMTNLYERVSPSVVHITSRIQQTDLFAGTQSTEGTGSGFVIDAQGHIVTNNHVIEGADQIEVVLSSGVSLPATVVGADSFYDLAVLKIDVPANALNPLEFADSSELKVGQMVVAIGNPFGLDLTMTQGMISALGRQVQSGPDSVIGQAIQTDAAINPGNSGGPLLDIHGRVVGVNTAIRSPSGGSVGIGFAVPANAVQRVVPGLISKGRYTHASLGITAAELGADVTPPRSGPTRGLLILKLTPGGAAEKAGVRAAKATTQGRRTILSGGDILVAIGNHPIESRTDMLLTLEENYKPGDKVDLTVIRDGQRITVSATIGEE